MNQVLVKYLAIQTGGYTGGDVGDALVVEHFRPICVVLSSCRPLLSSFCDGSNLRISVFK